MVYFTNWSFCLTLLSATLGAAVSVRYLILSHHFKHTVVHGRPGLTPQHRASQHTCACFGASNTLAATDDPEEGLMPPHTAEALTSQSHDSYIQPDWALQAPEQASSSEIQLSNGVQPSRPLNSSAQPAEAAFAKAHGHTRTPSDLDSLAPAELRYAPQVV